MSTLFSWQLSLPTGVELVILMGFLLLGITAIANLIIYRDHRSILPATVHVAGGVLAMVSGDLISLLLAWELLTFSAFFLLPASPHPSGSSVRLRYISIQIVAAVLFFVAVVVHVGLTGSFAVAQLHPQAQPFIVGALLIKAAVFPLHFWLVEAYPRAALHITPLLSVFATKVGVISAARLLQFTPGGVPLIGWIGAWSAVIGVIFALRQHNARRLLSYHIVSQIGYMVAAIGLAPVVMADPAVMAEPALMAAPVVMAGQALPAAAMGTAITAGLFHLLTHTFYKALLIMVAAYAAACAGGNEDLTTMGGLRLRKPLLLLFGLIGAAAISGVPFTSGYASKYLLKEVVATEPGIAVLLELASVGTGLSFIKFIYLIFWAPAVGAPAATYSAAGAPAAVRPTETEVTRQPPRFALVPLTIVAAVTVLMGAIPGHIPGIPQTTFFTWEAVRSALRPLAGSVVLWIVLKRRLTTPRATPERAPLRIPRLPVALFPRHDQDPRVQLYVALVALLGVVALLVLS